MIREPITIEGNVEYGKNLDTGYNVVLRDCKLGDDVCIWSGCVVDPKANIGNKVKLHVGCYVSQGVIIEDGVFVGPHVVFLNDKYPPRYDEGKWTPPVIKSGSIIGGGAVICPGVIIHERAIIAAGAVVTRDVPPGELWGGVPARCMNCR